MSRRKHQGFSVIEMVVTLAVIAIVAATVVPSMPAMIANRRVAAAADDLFATLLYARSEAIRLNRTVTVDAIDGDWSNGWEIPDPNNDGTFLSQHAMEKIAAKETFANVTSVSYAASGRMPLGVLPNILVCDSAGKAEGRQISIDPSGMPNIITGGCS